MGDLSICLWLTRACLFVGGEGGVGGLRVSSRHNDSQYDLLIIGFLSFILFPYISLLKFKNSFLKHWKFSCMNRSKVTWTLGEMMRSLNSSICFLSSFFIIILLCFDFLLFFSNLFSQKSQVTRIWWPKGAEILFWNTKQTCHTWSSWYCQFFFIFLLSNTWPLSTYCKLLSRYGYWWIPSQVHAPIGTNKHKEVFFSLWIKMNCRTLTDQCLLCYVMLW